MSKIRINYNTQSRTEFINELREKVNEYFAVKNLSKYGNISIIIKSVVMVLLYAIPFILTMTGLVSAVPLVILCWGIMGIGMAGLGMGLMHDANHRTYSKNARVNAFLGKSIYLLGGFPATWRFQHNTLHHGFTNIEGHDEDITTAGFLRFSPHQPHYKIHRLQQWYAWFFYCLMTISWITTKDFKQLKSFSRNDLFVRSNKKYSRLMTDLITSKVLYYIIFLVLPLIFIPIAWYWIVVAFFTMHFVAGLSLTSIFQTAHVMPTSEFPLPDENGNIENSWAIHQMMTTTDFAPKSKIFSWFIGGLNYQVVHHLFPTISHVHYKDIAVIVKTISQKYKLPYHVQPTFLKAIQSHFKMLKMLGQKQYSGA